MTFSNKSLIQETVQYLLHTTLKSVKFNEYLLHSEWTLTSYVLWLVYSCMRCVCVCVTNVQSVNDYAS